MCDDSLLLRGLHPGDAAALACFLCGNDVPEVTRTFHPFPMSAESAVAITSKTRRDRFFGAFLGNRIVGLSMLRGWDEGYEVPSFGIVVDRRCQGMGIGDRLTDFTLAEAARAGSARVRLSVYASNIVARRMYLARGFREVSRQEVRVGDTPDQKVVMMKDLEPLGPAVAPPDSGGHAR